MSDTPPTPELGPILRAAAYSAYHLSLCAHTVEAFEWFKNVQIGQLVIETSTIHFRQCNSHGIGWLVEKTQEPFPGDWGDEKPPLEPCWYIKCFDGLIYRWTNADFVRVPDSVCPWRTPIPTASQPSPTPSVTGSAETSAPSDGPSPSSLPRP